MAKNKELNYYKLYNEDCMQYLKKIKSNSIDSLVAIKCLDEGIDIPACKVAFIIASTSNPRQFIQRRGRILRRGL